MLRRFISPVGGAILLLSSVLALDAAEIDATRSALKNPFWGNLTLDLASDEVVGVRTRYLDEPYRIIFEFEAMDFADLPKDFGEGVKFVENVEFGSTQSGARMVLTLKQPYGVGVMDFSSQAVKGEMGLHVEFEEVSHDAFEALVARLGGDDRSIDGVAAREAGAEDLPLIIIDPGHGGHDPGAERHGVQEKNVTLNAAQIMADMIANTGRYRVILTRQDDEFFSLLERRQFAERMRGDILLSIHADTVEVGDARGTTIYKLSDRATSEIASHFARFENRVDLFAGENIDTDEEDIGLVLSDLAHKASRENAEILATALQRQWAKINVTPDESRVEAAAFGVLKAPEIPSLLLELGYLSNDDDFRKIRDPVWLGRMSQGVIEALDQYFETVY